MRALFTLKRGTALCRRWPSVLSRAQKEKKERAVGTELVCTVSRISEVQHNAASQADSAENALAASERKAQPVHSITQPGQKEFLTAAVLQSPRRLSAPEEDASRKKAFFKYPFSKQP